MVEMEIVIVGLREVLKQIAMSEELALVHLLARKALSKTQQYEPKRNEDRDWRTRDR
jgi:hypothetical protein